MSAHAPTEKPQTLAFERLQALRSSSTSVRELTGPLADIAALDVKRDRTDRLLLYVEQALEHGTAADVLVRVWEYASAENRAGLRLLASLVEVRRSGLELLRAMIRPVQMLRACALWARPNRPAYVSESLVSSGQALGVRIGLGPNALASDPVAAVARFHERALQLVNRMLEQPLSTSELSWLQELAFTELRAQSEKLQALADRVGAYDGRRISRLLPVLSRQEERIRDTRVMLLQWPNTDELRRRASVLAKHLDAKQFNKLVAGLESAPQAADLALALKLNASFVPPTPALLFATAVLRRLDADTRPPGGSVMLDAARCLLLALRFGGHACTLRLRLGAQQMRASRVWLDRLRLAHQDNVLQVSFEPSRHESWLAADAVPEFVELDGFEPPKDMRQLVLSNMGNEIVLCGLLKNPHTARVGGLIESVALRTRSVKVLLEIANARDLYASSANRNVPQILLAHPTSIPLGSLRKFVHVRFVDRTALGAMVLPGAQVRPEVRALIGGYLRTLGSH